MEKTASMKALPEKEMSNIIGGVKWACDTCGYVSNNHIFLSTANQKRNEHDVKHHNGKRIYHVIFSKE